MESPPGVENSLRVRKRNIIRYIFLIDCCLTLHLVWPAVPMCHPLLFPGFLSATFTLSYFPVYHSRLCLSSLSHLACLVSCSLCIWSVLSLSLSSDESLLHFSLSHIIFSLSVFPDFYYSRFRLSSLYSLFAIICSLYLSGLSYFFCLPPCSFFLVFSYPIFIVLFLFSQCYSNPRRRSDRHVPTLFNLLLRFSCEALFSSWYFRLLFSTFFFISEFYANQSKAAECAISNASTSAISPSAAAPVEDIVSWILDGRGISITLENFPHYLCDRTKHALVGSFWQHMRLKENSELLDAGRLRTLLSGPTGSRDYQEKLAMALANRFGAKLLVMENHFFPADLYTMGLGPSRDVLWTHFRQHATQSSAYSSQSEMNCHSFRRGDRVIFVGSNSGGLCSTDSPWGPTFGSLGEIVFLVQVSNLSRLGVRFDKPIQGGLYLRGQSEAGYVFHCNASELCLDPTTLMDFDKSITNNYLEAITRAS